MIYVVDVVVSHLSKLFRKVENPIICTHPPVLVNTYFFLRRIFSLFTYIGLSCFYAFSIFATPILRPPKNEFHSISVHYNIFLQGNSV
jgi:hypothetical protein